MCPIRVGNCFLISWISRQWWLCHNEMDFSLWKVVRWHSLVCKMQSGLFHKLVLPVKLAENKWQWNQLELLRVCFHPFGHTWKHTEILFLFFMNLPFLWWEWVFPIGCTVMAIWHINIREIRLALLLRVLDIAVIIRISWIITFATSVAIAITHVLVAGQNTGRRANRAICSGLPVKGGPKICKRGAPKGVIKNQFFGTFFYIQSNGTERNLLNLNFTAIGTKSVFTSNFRKMFSNLNLL